VRIVAVLGAVLCIGAAVLPPLESAVSWLAAGLGVLLGAILWTLSDIAQSRRSPRVDTAAMMQQLMLQARMGKGRRPEGPGESTKPQQSSRSLREGSAGKLANATSQFAGFLASATSQFVVECPQERDCWSACR